MSLYYQAAEHGYGRKAESEQTAARHERPNEDVGVAERLYTSVEAISKRFGHAREGYYADE
jgi:hypothetical protein